MRTLNRAVIILALFIPFSLTIPIVEMIAPCSKPCHPELVSGSLSRIGVRGLTSLFSIQPAEAYTYQDVENAYNAAKAQYPNDYIFIEEFNQDGKKGYKIWKRPKITTWVLRKIIFINGSPTTGTYSGYISKCTGNRFDLVFRSSKDTFYSFLSTPSAHKIEYKYCDGSTITQIDNIPPNKFGISDTCWYDTQYNNVNCAANDVLLATFFPIDECEDTDGDGVTTCDGDCNDNDPAIYPGATELCDNKDNNCDGQTDENACCPDSDKDGITTCDGDCDDSNPLITHLQINSFTASKTTINPSAGETATLSGAIAGGGDNPSWTITIAGKTFSGTGSPSALWDGKGTSSFALDDGTYTATLTVSSGSCTDTETLTITVKNECLGTACCKINTNVGSTANIAGGNLYHSQSLFSIPNSKLGADFTLSYNSQDGTIGSLGLGWTHSYNISIREDVILGGEKNLIFRDGDGRRLIYYNNGSGTYRPDSTSGEHSTITENLDGTYLLTKKDGAKYYFDTAGRLTKIEDRLANIMTFTYTGGDPSTGSGQRLAEITDSVGRKTTLTYDSNNRITSITDLTGRTVTFTYNTIFPLNKGGEGVVLLTAVTDSAGYSWTYTYDSTGRMLTKSDTEGNLVTYAYDSTSRVISSTDSSGKAKTISYSSPLVGEGGVLRGQTTVTERDGGVWSYTYDSANGTLTQKTDPQGNTTTYQYDSNRNLIKETASDGSITSYTYDAQGNMTSVTDASGNTTNYTYNDYGQTTSIKDPQNNVTYYSYDVYGNLNSVSDPSGGMTQFNYDSKGNITRITSPNGGVTVYEYDQYNNITKITDPSGNITSFTYDSAGNMTSMTDSSGNTTRFEYNTLNQLIRVIDSNGNTTEYSFDSRGNKTSQTDANGNTTYYEYNSNDKLTKVTDALNNVTTYTYGGTGGCPSCGTGGGDNLTTIKDANGNITTYEYDTLGRLIKETDPLGNAITYAYDSKGNLTLRTDANGNTIAYTYDALERLTKKTYPDSTTESFTYDSKGNILTASNKNISYTFTYDASGKVVNTTDSYGRTIKYEYDVSGNKTQMTTPEEKIIKYNYDVSHRLTQIKAPSPLAGEGGGEGVFSFTYDTSGRRTKLTYPNGVTTNYTYDSSGRLTNLLTQYAELKDQGKKRPPTIKLHTIDSFTYTHDKVGNRLTKSETSSPSPLEGEGGVRGVKYSYSYDAIHRLLQSLPTKLQGKDKEQENKLAPEGLNQGTELFTYDPVGNRLTGPKEKLNYTYNTVNQLTELMKEKKEEEEKKTEYTYDKNGNLTKKIELGDEGQIKKTTLYTYDYENRLVKVEIQKGDRLKIVAFTYDSFGRRLSKSVSHLSLRGEAEAISEEDDDNDYRDDDKDDDDKDSTLSLSKDDEDKESPKATYYVYDNEDIILEYNHKGKVTARYVHGLGIDEPLAVEKKEDIFYYHADGLGSITALTDSKGKVVQRYDYDSFGKLKRQGNKVKNAYTYTAREYDRETGLYYYRARYYDSQIGRFINKDSFPGYLNNPQTLNPYQYTLNAPINWIDPYGYLTWGERAFTAFLFAFRVFSPVPGYVEGLGVIKPIPVVGPVLDVLFTPSTLGNPVLGPDGNWYYPDGTPVDPALPPIKPCGKK